MKKWAILIVVVLMGLLLGLQYFNTRNKDKLAATNITPPPQEHTGISLPPEAADAGKYPPESQYPVGTFGADIFSVQGTSVACEGGSVNEILNAKGKTWGPKADTSKNPVLSVADTEKMSLELSKYITCEAFAGRDLTACAYAAPDLKSWNYTSKECTQALNDFLAMEYMAGRRSEISSCMWIITDDAEDWPGSGLKGISPGDFCPSAGKGMEKICAGVPALSRKDCPKMFPSKKSDCDGNKRCLETFALYEAIKTGDAGKCGAENMEYCRMYFGKISCKAFASSASKAYCSGLARASENSLSALKERKEAERLAVQEKVEQEKLLQQINKEVKGLVGNK